MILNVTNTTNQTAYVCVYGQDQQGRWCFYKNGMLNVATINEDTHQFFYILTAGKGMNLSYFPLLSSGVVLICYGGYPQVFNVVADINGKPSIQSPPFVPGSADAGTVFTMVEFTYDKNGCNVDTTNVDYYSVPVVINLTGTDSGGNDYDKTAGEMKYSRDQIFENFLQQAQGTEFESLVMKDYLGNNVRILGPQHGVQASLINAGYFDAYIDACWATYKDEPLIVTTNSNTYTGMVDETDTMCFSLKGSTTILYKVAKPGPGKAFDIFGCCGVLLAPNDEYGAIVARIGAAINRGVLHNESNQPYCNDASFYQVSNTNLYAKVLHECYNGGGYAFPFDDVCNEYSSDMGCANPNTFAITL